MLFSSNSDKIIAPASLTKLLTACVALRYANAETVFTVGSEQNLVNAGSSLCLIAEGHRLRLYDLIMGMLLASGNDAAYAVAANTARYAADTEMSDKEAVTFFCGLMNEFASDLGMTDSHFSNPDGWDAPDHYTTVNDLLKLTRYALSVPEIREIAATQQKYVVFASGENVTWTNSNRLLDPDSDYYCEYAVGMKTGTTENAGTSDVFYRLWEHRENIKPELGLHSYISAITRSVVKNRLRRQAPTAEDISELDLSSDFDVENIALLNEMTACLNEGLNTLTTDDREIFLRYYLYGETSPQIAKVMNIPLNTVYSKLRRTKSKLKNFLSERGYDNV